MKKTLIKKYAKLIAVQGINLKKNQPVKIFAPVHAASFVEVLVEQLYKSGAGKVTVEWQDEKITKTVFKYESKKSLSTVFSPLIT